VGDRVDAAGSGKGPAGGPQRGPAAGVRRGGPRAGQACARAGGRGAGTSGSSGRDGVKSGCIFPSMLPLLSSPLAYFFLPPFHSFEALCHLAPITLAASCGVGTSRLQRPSIRAGTHTRHPMLSASFDDSRQACRRRPHLYDGFFARPGKITGRLHQHQGQSLTQHRQTAHAALSSAPCGITPVSRKRQSAMSNLRATATIPIRLMRLPPPPKRSRNQQLRALSG